MNKKLGLTFLHTR